MRRKELREKRSDLSLQGLVLCTCLHPAVVYFVEMDDNRILKWGKETLWCLLTTAENSDNCGRTTRRGNGSYWLCCIWQATQVHCISASIHLLLPAAYSCAGSWEVLDTVPADTRREAGQVASLSQTFCFSASEIQMSALGVPQGWILSPSHFHLYMLPLEIVSRRHGIKSHCYADHTAGCY